MKNAQKLQVCLQGGTEMLSRKKCKEFAKEFQFNLKLAMWTFDVCKSS